MRQGQPCTKYLKFSFEKGRPLTYSQNPDLAQTVAPSNESRTQLAVNNEGKTNEATKHVKEPLQQGQTAPKDETQQKRQTKKSKGMRVPCLPPLNPSDNNQRIETGFEHRPVPHIPRTRTCPVSFPSAKNKSINRLNRKRHDYHIGRKTERRP